MALLHQWHCYWIRDPVLCLSPAPTDLFDWPFLELCFWSPEHHNISTTALDVPPKPLCCLMRSALLIQQFYTEHYPTIMCLPELIQCDRSTINHLDSWNQAVIYYYACIRITLFTFLLLLLQDSFYQESAQYKYV